MHKLLPQVLVCLLVISFACTLKDEVQPTIPTPPATPTFEDSLAANKVMYDTQIINRWWKYFYNADTVTWTLKLDSAMFVPTASDKGNFYKTSINKNPIGTYKIPTAPGTSILDYSMITVYDSIGTELYTAKMSVRPDEGWLIFTFTNGGSSTFFLK